MSGQRGEQAGAGEKREGARIGKGPTPGADPRKTSRCGWRLDLPSCCPVARMSSSFTKLGRLGAAVGADSLSRTLTGLPSRTRGAITELGCNTTRRARQLVTFLYANTTECGDGKKEGTTTGRRWRKKTRKGPREVSRRAKRHFSLFPAAAAGGTNLERRPECEGPKCRQLRAIEVVDGAERSTRAEPLALQVSG